MGFMDFIYKGLGFASSDENVELAQKPEKIKKQKEEKPIKKIENTASFNFSQKEEPAKQNSQATSQAKTKENISMFLPKSQEDIKKIVEFVRKRVILIVNLSNFAGEELAMTISYLKGAMFALHAEVQELEPNKQFLLTPPQK